MFGGHSWLVVVSGYAVLNGNRVAARAVAEQDLGIGHARVVVHGDQACQVQACQVQAVLVATGIARTAETSGVVASASEAPTSPGGGDQARDGESIAIATYTVSS
jgi:hypothetical protein